MSSKTVSLTLPRSRHRRIKDQLARVGVTAGGILVLVALLLIFFYLLYVVMPIFEPASIQSLSKLDRPESGQTALLGVDDKNHIGYRFTRSGELDFFALDEATGVPIGQRIVHQQVANQPVAVARNALGKPVLAYGYADGSVSLLHPDFNVSYPDGRMQITPGVKYPLGETPLLLDAKHRPIEQLALAVTSARVLLAATVSQGDIILLALDAKTDRVTGAVSWSSARYPLPVLPGQPDQILLTPNQHSLLVRTGNLLSIFDIRDLAHIRLRSAIPVNASDANVTTLTLLSGASSVLVGNDNGVISQWFEVLHEGVREWTHIRDFQAAGAVREIAVETNRKGFAVLSGDNQVELFHTTGERRLLSASLGEGRIQHLTLSPRNNRLLLETDQQLHVYQVKNDYPEVTWSALWRKVWYEGYPEPQYVWQSTAASDDFEAKFSLVPLVFGTLKAAAYALLFAVPIALSGAIYAGYFMSVGLRRIVKPTIEIMAAMPTVILGFLAGLWLAPLVEQNLPGVFLMLLALPLSMLLSALLWYSLPRAIKGWVPEGWQALLLVPVLLLVGYVCLGVSPWLETAFFHGNLRSYLTHDLGWRFDQRNALVVGIAMGFAVIPTIFSIAEDAVFSVPKHLTKGSLALGATTWQTLTRVVLLTASPGIFSAVMMGLGRAVGETMIVLMATGNTPVMDMSIFQGLRTLAANIAVEMPESEVGSSHYRVLFLAAFVLFMFTFVFNSLAEFVRQRLREKYSTL